jgi:ketosteroid isomerase-like protein
MASANLDLVRSIYAAVGRGDYSSAGWADPEIAYVVADGPEPGRVTGLVGLAEVMRTILSVSDDLHTEVEEYRELDAERVLVLTRWNSRGKKSGVPVVGAGAEVFMIRDGRVIGITLYNDRGRALADLGLTPGADSP